MGTGSDAAIEASDLTLVRGDLLAVPDAILLSRRMLATIKGNLIWAFGYNAAAIPLAALGFLNPLMAAAAMAFSSVFVVTKPFSPREVAARVKAVLRRDRGVRETGAVVLRFDGLTVDPGTREVEADGTPVGLSALEFDLLAALAEAPGRVFSRRQLLERVWGYDFFGDERVVDVHIRSLRARLGDDAANPRLIATVRGVGYKFTGRPA